MSDTATYVTLMEAFANGSMGPDEFEERYRELFVNDPEMSTPEDVFRVLDKVFADVDAYVSDPDLRDAADGDIGPTELRELVRVALRRLRTLDVTTSTG